MQIKHWRAVGVGLTILLTPNAAAAQGADSMVLARAGGDYDVRAMDQARCRGIANAAPEQDLPRTGSRAGAGGYGGYAGVDVAIGAAIAFAILGAIDTNRARGKAEVFCMTNLGYVGVPLTAAEAAEYRSVRDAGRADWERAFLSGDLADRIRPLLVPAVPPLPPYRVEPATQGGVKFDLTTLIPAAEPVSAGGVLVAGSATRWRTAVLAEPFATATAPLQLAAAAGTVFHQVDYRPQRDPLLRDQGATWCGPVSETGTTGSATQVWCFTSHPNGYDVFKPTGFAWLAGPYRDGIVLPRHTGPILLDGREGDDLDDLDDLHFEIRASAVTRNRITIEGQIARTGRRVILWRREFRLTPGETVTLPLWSRRLLVTRTDDALTAVIDDQGTGEGPRA